MTHWCRDISRDEAVRAAEDGRSGPLPTLEEAIAAASPLPGRVEGTHWADWERLRDERDTLKARVAELESAAKLAPAANADGGSNHAAPAASGAAGEEDSDIGYALRLFVDGRRVLSHELDRQQAGAFLIAADHLAKYLRTEYQPPVEEAASEWRILALGEIVKDGDEYLQSDGRWLEVSLRHEIRTQDAGRFRRRVTAPAASGAAVLAEIAAAFGCEPDDDADLVEAAKLLVRERDDAVAMAASGAAGAVWLTAEDRGSIWYAIEGLREAASRRNNGHARALESLLARSSPPEVVLEDFTPGSICNLHPLYLHGWNQCMALAKGAIRAAGVSVKEVGRE